MTATTLADSIARLAPHLPAELFPPAGLERMRRATSRLPGALARVIGFECRLGPGDWPADLLFLADVASGGRAILAGGHPWAALPRELLAAPAWRTVQGFSAVWADPGSPLHRGVDDVWFELDLDDPGEEDSGPAPSLFFGPKVAHLEAATVDDPERRAQRGSVEILCAALALLRGAPLAGPWRDQLVRCVEALPPSARIFQVGLMLSRPSQPVRLCITNLPAAAISPYLARAGWEDPAAGLDPLLADLAPVAGSIKLTLDVSADVGSRIGLECYPGMDHAWQPGPRWEALLDHLVRRGLATEAKRAALLAFPGLGAAADDLAALLGGQAERVLVRWLHHAKVTYEPGRLSGAKAYLAVRGDWLR
jgi:hypothetical protein